MKVSWRLYIFFLSFLKILLFSNFCTQLGLKPEPQDQELQALRTEPAGAPGRHTFSIKVLLRMYLPKGTGHSYEEHIPLTRQNVWKHRKHSTNEEWMYKVIEIILDTHIVPFFLFLKKKNDTTRTAERR